MHCSCISIISRGCAVHCTAVQSLSIYGNPLVVFFPVNIIVHISQSAWGLLSLFNQHFSEHDLDITRRLNVNANKNITAIQKHKLCKLKVSDNVLTVFQKEIC